MLSSQLIFPKNLTTSVKIECNILISNIKECFTFASNSRRNRFRIIPFSHQHECYRSYANDQRDRNCEIKTFFHIHLRALSSFLRNIFTSTTAYISQTIFFKLSSNSISTFFPMACMIAVISLSYFAFTHWTGYYLNADHSAKLHAIACWGAPTLLEL